MPYERAADHTVVASSEDATGPQDDELSCSATQIAALSDDEERERGAEMCRRRCSVGDADACATVGWIHKNGLVEPDEDVMTRMYGKACALGERNACSFAGGHLRLTDPQAAAGSFETGCELGSTQSCARLGELVEHDEPKRAVTLYRRACDAGHAFGCAKLGEMLLDGKGVAADENEALRLFERGCAQGQAAQGEALSCANLGNLFERGRVVKRDTKKAHALYEQACRVDVGQVHGCYRLGRMLALGIGRAPEPARASELLTAACDKGVYNACSFLARMYEQGDGVARDPDEALRLYGLACQAGLASACDGADRLDP